MAHAIRMPKPGQMTEECVLTSWLKAEGDPVHRGDVLFEIETDKSSMEVEAFDEGVLLRRLVPEGATVPVNAICGWVGMPGEEIPETEVAPPVGTAPLGVTPAAAPAAEAGDRQAGGTAPAAPTGATVVTSAPSTRAASSTRAAALGRLRMSPRATRLAAEAGIDPRTLAGTGPGGRIVERDVRAAIDDAATQATATTVTGPGPMPPAPAATGAPEAPTFVVPPVEGEDEPRPLSRMRRIIADRLTASYRTTPHFTVTVSADVTRLMAHRTELKSAGVDLTVTDFVLAAVAQTLAEFPDVNSRTDGVSVYPRRRVHLGLAVALPAGLVVPVIRDADRLTVAEIHDRAAALGAAARDGKLTVDEMTGSTFTVSNLGMFGVDEFSAIINPGEAAILAVASALRQPVAIGDALAVRWMMKLTLSSDHRLVDGEMAARFLNALRRRLEDARSLRID
jgi:pyruvate dehydrogenase E2 component (dihydrolipoamide acetyltransferase)